MGRSSDAESSAEEDEPSNARDAIMGATFRVLCDEGYAGLTMRAIAAEAGTSKSLLHYHYDTKDELLVAFLERFTDRLDRIVSEVESESDDPETRLYEFVDRFVVQPENDDRRSLWRALLEMRLRAAHEEAFREQLTANAEALRGELASIIADGVESGAFREVDPGVTADFIIDALEGARTRQATLGTDDAPLRARRAVREHVLEDLVRDERERTE